MKFLILFAGLALSIPTLAMEYLCPESLPLIKDGRAGAWSTYIDPTKTKKVEDFAYFYSAEIRDGDLSMVGTLIPDNDEQEGKYWEWSLSWDADKSYKNFAACSYTGSNVVLVKELPRNLIHCKVARGHGSKARVVSCR